MDEMMIVLRLIHIFAAVFWAGAAFFMIRFLMPTVRVTGQEGGRFMTRMLAETAPHNVITAAAVLTLLSGIGLYWRDSNGFEAAWMKSNTGIVFGIGAVAGLLAAGLAAHVTRPCAKKLIAISASIAAAGGTPTPEHLADIMKTAGKMGRALTWTVILLSISLACMAAARYVWT